MHPKNIAIQDFSYDLPTEQIAFYPSEDRDGSRLLVYKNQVIDFTDFRKIAEYLPAEAILFFNQTKVISARLIFEINAQQNIEIFCLNPKDKIATMQATMDAHSPVVWNCLVGNAKKWKSESIQKSVFINGAAIELSAKKIAKEKDGFWIEFSWQNTDYNFAAILEAIGQVPLPPYIKRNANQLDKTRYQTVYAEKLGSVAAPTAGLHFSPTILNHLKAKKIDFIPLTLHVGAGTFQPVKSLLLGDHSMHAEPVEIDIETIRHCIKKIEQPLIAVGTTSLRCLETLYWMGVWIFYYQQQAKTLMDIELEAIEIKQWAVYENPLNQIDLSRKAALSFLLEWMEAKQIFFLKTYTQLLIAPPYKIKMADALITNFHQPNSTLLLIVASIVGHDWKKIYQSALENNFQFLSYGDSSLLWINEEERFELSYLRCKKWIKKINILFVFLNT